MGTHTSIIHRLQSMLDQEKGRHAARAVSVAIRIETVSIASVLSREDYKEKPPFDLHARFLVYNISKTFTAAAVLRLAAAERLHLDDPLSRWLPDIPNASRITIRHCLQHTSGLPDYGALPEYHAAVRRGDRPWSFEEFMERTNAGELLFAPGQGWSYSTIGYMVLRRLLETACGTSFANLLRSEIFEPLNLKSTSVPARRADLQDITFGPSVYLGGNAAPLAVSEIYDPAWLPAGVIASTAAETAQFYDALLAGKLFPREFLNQMCAAVRAADAPGHPSFYNPGYGLGLMITDSPCGMIYGHTGSGPGCSAAAFHFKKNGTSITVTILSDGENVSQTEHMAILACTMLAESD